MLVTYRVPLPSRSYFGDGHLSAPAVRTNGLSALLGFFSHLNIAYEA